jgi:alanine racemase
VEKQNFERKDLRVLLNTDAILHNVSQLKSCCNDNVKFCAVLKANAYGHGALTVASILKNAGIDFFAVDNVYEAFYISKSVSNAEILILEPLHPALDAEVISYCNSLKMHCTITSLESAKYVSSILADTDTKLNVHINIDTGMSRCGIEPALAGQLAEYINSASSMKLAGIYTHFANVNEKDLSFAKAQLVRFKNILSELKSYITNNTIIHAANSAATIVFSESHFDMVRCGISIYGYNAVEASLPVKLRPGLKLQAPVIHIASLSKGQTVSYGRTYIANRDTKIAVLPIGYSDGFWRRFFNKAKVRIGAEFAPVIGRITMNQIVIDITDTADVKLGDYVTIIDNRFDSPCGVYQLAKLSDTICYEILTSVPSRAQTILQHD